MIVSHRTDSPPQTLIGPSGTRIAYRRLPGHGPGVIFLGGFLSDMSGAKAIRLEGWCRARGQAFVRFDYSGHGASQGRLEDGTIGAWAAEAVTVIDDLSDGPQVLVGSSLGGWLMVLAARERPARVAGLLGVAAALDFTEEVLWKRLDSASRARLLSAGKVWVPSAYRDVPYPIALQLIEEGRRHLLLDRPLALDLPVRLLHGMDDQDIPWETSVRLARAVTGDDVRVILVKDGDHRLSRDQDLDLLIREVAELCDRCGLRAAAGPT